MHLSDSPGLARLEGPKHLFKPAQARLEAADADIQKCQAMREDETPQVREIQAIMSRACVSATGQARIYDLMAELGVQFQHKESTISES